ncbi:MAG TPA: NUDIX hydrolase, partial [Methylomirabilota bacterium]|nr:NUDIX hydrolase [Methylomirabilota bacterium]
MQTSPSGKAGADLVEVAAGGLVWRGRGPFRKLAIVHRAAPDRNDWVLPKGKLDRGERPEDAALREVKEEAQVEARLGAPAGCTTHSKNGQPKVTLYWHMRVMRRFEFQPNAEIDQVRWLRPDRAIRLLTHPNERHLVLRECGRGARGSRWCFRGRSPRQDRLETAIAFARTHLNLLAVRAADTAPSAPPASKLISLL